MRGARCALCVLIACAFAELCCVGGAGACALCPLSSIVCVCAALRSAWGWWPLTMSPLVTRRVRVASCVASVSVYVMAQCDWSGPGRSESECRTLGIGEQYSRTPYCPYSVLA